MNNIKNEIDNLLRHWYISKKTREYEQKYAKERYEKTLAKRREAYHAKKNEQSA